MTSEIRAEEREGVSGFPLFINNDRFTLLCWQSDHDSPGQSGHWEDESSSNGLEVKVVDGRSTWTIGKIIT
jgi:hypothetical protein